MVLANTRWFEEYACRLVGLRNVRVCWWSPRQFTRQNVILHQCVRGRIEGSNLLTRVYPRTSRRITPSVNAPRAISCEEESPCHKLCCGDTHRPGDSTFCCVGGDLYVNRSVTDEKNVLLKPQAMQRRYLSQLSSSRLSSTLPLSLSLSALWCCGHSSLRTYAHQHTYKTQDMLNGTEHACKEHTSLKLAPDANFVQGPSRALPPPTNVYPEAVPFPSHQPVTGLRVLSHRRERRSECDALQGVGHAMPLHSTLSHARETRGQHIFTHGWS